MNPTRRKLWIKVLSLFLAFVMVFTFISIIVLIALGI